MFFCLKNYMKFLKIFFVLNFYFCFSVIAQTENYKSTLKKVLKNTHFLVLNQNFSVFTKYKAFANSNETLNNTINNNTFGIAHLDILLPKIPKFEEKYQKKNSPIIKYNAQKISTQIDIHPDFPNVVGYSLTYFAGDAVFKAFYQKYKIFDLKELTNYTLNLDSSWVNADKNKILKISFLHNDKKEKGFLWINETLLKIEKLNFETKIETKKIDNSEKETLITIYTKNTDILFGYKNQYIFSKNIVFKNRKNQFFTDLSQKDTLQTTNWDYVKEASFDLINLSPEINSFPKDEKQELFFYTQKSNYPNDEWANDEILFYNHYLKKNPIKLDTSNKSIKILLNAYNTAKNIENGSFVLNIKDENYHASFPNEKDKYTKTLKFDFQSQNFHHHFSYKYKNGVENDTSYIFDNHTFYEIYHKQKKIETSLSIKRDNFFSHYNNPIIFSPLIHKNIYFEELFKILALKGAKVEYLGEKMMDNIVCEGIEIIYPNDFIWKIDKFSEKIYFRKSDYLPIFRHYHKAHSAKSYTPNEVQEVEQFLTDVNFNHLKPNFFENTLLDLRQKNYNFKEKPLTEIEQTILDLKNK